jgi:hypothetical protein
MRPFPVFAVALALALCPALGLSGCATTRSPVRLVAPPPPPPPLVVQPRPEALWVAPHVGQVAGQAVERVGHWVPVKPGMVWVAGEWRDAGGYWRWHWGHFVKAPSDVAAP